MKPQLLPQSLVGLLVISLACSGRLSAQAPSVCDPLRAAPGITGYREWTDDICEGMYRSDINVSPGLTVLSLTLGELPEVQEGDTALVVRVPAAASDSEGEVRIRGLARAPRTYYRLDARARSGGPFRWNLQRVVRREGLKVRELGLYAWVGEGPNERLNLPVLVAKEGEVVEDGASRPVYLWVRSNRSSDRVTWRVTGNDGVPAEWKLLDLSGRGSRIPAGQPFRIDVSELRNRGVVSLAVGARVAGTSEWARLNIRVRAGAQP